MTVLEQWKQLAARENAAMRAVMGIGHRKMKEFHPPKSGRAVAKARDDIRKIIVKAVADNPGQRREDYLAATGLSYQQWKGAITPLLQSRSIIIRRNGIEHKATYEVGQ